MFFPTGLASEQDNFSARNSTKERMFRSDHLSVCG